MSKGTFYITTPIYYPSDKLHIGHTYCTVATDTMARYKRMCGYDVMFLTGVDEHGQKIEEKAKEAGVCPKKFVDSIVEGAGGILDLWKLMNISNDRFIRTTDDYHILSIQRIFKKMYEAGDIYKSSYKGLYCTPCESFWTDSQLVDGKCPDCGRDVKYAEEEAYFFRLSKYQRAIERLYAERPEFLEPESRRNEMLNNFIKPGLEDLCVSRTSFTWGVPVDFDPGHVVYVWIDALSNYATALGYLNERYSDYEKFWPADVHMVGKEIVRFHSIIWPAMLMSLGEPLPRKVFGHGWLLLDGGKMSKSKGNVVDPVVLAGRYGVDALRYFLLREFPFGSDGSFSNELLISRINSDLANDFGNLVSRTVTMVLKYFGGKLPVVQELGPEDSELIGMAARLREVYEASMEKLAFQSALSEVFRLISRANKYIDETTPWILAKNKASEPRLARVMYNLLETVRICAGLLTPFMPESSARAFDQLCIQAIDTGSVGGTLDPSAGLSSWDSLCKWGALPQDTDVKKGEVLFPRIDAVKELDALAKLEAEKARETDSYMSREGREPETLDITEFKKIELTVAEILECEQVPKSDKLLRIQLDSGDGKRQIVSGIAKWYTPEQLVGRKVILVKNLKPAKLRGVESRGMLLAADHGEAARVIFVDNDIPAGSSIH